MKLTKLSSVFLALALTAAASGCSEKKPGSNPDNSDIINVSPRNISFEWQSLYEQKLNEFKSTDKFSETADNGTEESRFDLCDLNSDGTPELIISANNAHTTTCEVFTVSGGEVISIGEIGEYGSFTYYPDFKLIKSEYSGDGFVLGKFISFNGKEFVESMTYSDNSGEASKGAEIKHEIDGKELSLPEYDEAMAVYKDAKTLSLGRKYTFGEATVEYAMNCSESWGAVLTPKEKEIFREQLMKNLNTATETGKDAGFELCDLNNDEIPELIVSEGTSEDDGCKIYYISGNTLLEVEGTYGYKGKFYFDNEQLVFYMTGAPSGNACWSLTNSDISSFNVSRSHMECGRRYILSEESVNSSMF